MNFLIYPSYFLGILILSLHYTFWFSLFTSIPQTLPIKHPLDSQKHVWFENLRFPVISIKKYNPCKVAYISFRIPLSSKTFNEFKYISPSYVNSVEILTTVKMMKTNNNLDFKILKHEQEILFNLIIRTRDTSKRRGIYCSQTYKIGNKLILLSLTSDYKNTIKAWKEKILKI